MTPFIKSCNAIIKKIYFRSFHISQQWHLLTDLVTYAHLPECWTHFLQKGSEWEPQHFQSLLKVRNSLSGALMGPFCTPFWKNEHIFFLPDTSGFYCVLILLHGFHWIRSRNARFSAAFTEFWISLESQISPQSEICFSTIEVNSGVLWD